MRQKDFVEHIENTYRECVAIVKNKNQDYAREDDPWRNFRFSRLVGVSVKKAILVRITDKIARINNIIDKDGEHAVKDETVQDTCLDCINYLAILLAYLDNEKHLTKKK